MAVLGLKMVINPSGKARKNVKLLPGLSVPEWKRLTALFNFFGWFEIALLIPLGIFWAEGAKWPMPFFVLLCVCGFVQIQIYNLNIGSAGKSVKEQKAGYTTDFYHYREDVHLVVPRTGVIIRPAGEPQITEEQYRKAVQLYGLKQKRKYRD